MELDEGTGLLHIMRHNDGDVKIGSRRKPEYFGVFMCFDCDPECQRGVLFVRRPAPPAESEQGVLL